MHLAPLGTCSPMRALCAVCVCCWWLCLPSSPPPNFLFFFFLCFFLLFLFFFKWERGRVHTAGTGMASWCSGAVVLRSPVWVLPVLLAATPQGCGLRVLMYMGAGQGGFGYMSLCALVLAGLVAVWAVGVGCGYCALSAGWIGGRGSEVTGCGSGFSTRVEASTLARRLWRVKQFGRLRAWVRPRWA